MAAKSDSVNPADNVVATTMTAGANQQEVRLRIDDTHMESSYANAFRTNATPEELMLDFGINLVNQQPPQGAPPELLFKATNRVVMNFYMAKRLAIMLGQVIRQHEDSFGTLELDVAKRRKA
jgi:hypothetical protein